MKMIIVTGMSGAGKSTALNVFEDEGYYCVDNMPISLIVNFAELANGQKDGYENIALGIDIRSGQTLSGFLPVLEELKKRHYDFSILFLDASDEVLVKRYKETRRSHPLAKDERVDRGIELERSKLSFLRDKANTIIDTSQLLTRELKQEITNIYFKNKQFSNLFVTVLSFGFKYGIPSDADIVLDVRFLPNPYYIDDLRYKTGNDKEVQEFVNSTGEAVIFTDKLEDMVRFLLPRYVKEGKNSLVIAIGCTGGKHRSVTIANFIGERIAKSEYGCKIDHRDIEKDTKTKGEPKITEV